MVGLLHLSRDRQRSCGVVDEQPVEGGLVDASPAQQGGELVEQEGVVAHLAAVRLAHVIPTGIVREQQLALIAALEHGKQQVGVSVGGGPEAVVFQPGATLARLMVVECGDAVGAR